MCRHSRSRSLAVCSCHTKPLVRLRQESQHLRTFLYLETMFAEIHQFLVSSRDSWSIHHQCTIFLLETVFYCVNILLIMDFRPFFNQPFCQFAWRLVITAHIIPLCQEITHQCAHTNATSANKINRLYLLRLHHFFFFLYSIANL